MVTGMWEGWHRTDERNPGPQPAIGEQKALIALRAHLECGRAGAERSGRWDLVTLPVRSPDHAMPNSARPG